MSSEGRYRFAAPDVIHEALDDEVMLIDLAQGIYYSLSGSGALVYDLLVAGASADELAQGLAAQTDGDQATIEAAVGRLLDALRQHGLMAEAPDAPAATSTAPAGAEARAPFVEPKLEAFSELQDLLIADPVHEVEPAGWPNVKSST